MHVATLIFKSKHMAKISALYMFLHCKSHLGVRPFKDEIFWWDAWLNFVACEKTGIGTVSHTGKNHVSKNTNTSNGSKTLEAAVSKRNVIGAMSVSLYFPVDTLKKNSGINFHILKLTQYI